MIADRQQQNTLPQRLSPLCVIGISLSAGRSAAKKVTIIKPITAASSPRPPSREPKAP